MRFLVSVAFLLLAGHSAVAAPRVLASIKPVQSIVAAVMGEAGTPELLIPGGASPHSYALKPSEARAIARADVVFWIGPELETFLRTPLKTLAPRARVVALMEAEGVTKLEARKGGLWEADADDHAGIDGHVWLNPANAIAMARAVARVLAAADRMNTLVYLRNAERFVDRTRQLDDALHKRLANVRDRPYIVFHDAYRYFEAHYGLSPVGAVTIASERPPGARRVAELRAKIRAAGAVCLFTTPQFASPLVATLTEGSAIRTATLDDMGADIPPGADFYRALLTRIADSLATCLAR